MKLFSLFCVIVYFAIVIPYTKASMSIEVDTRYSTVNQIKGDPDHVFAEKLKNYVLNSPQPRGYCKKSVQNFPISNRDFCGADRNIGWIWKFSFTDQEDANYKIQFATDMGRGFAIFVDGQFLSATQKDIWWGNNWNSNGVINMDFDFKAGDHTVVWYGMEQCCDGDMYVRFSRKGQSWQDLDEDNLNCSQTNNCPGVSCTDKQYQNGPDCVDCSYKCNTCQNDEICYQCSDSNREIPQCDCKIGYYNVENQPKCIKCDNSCLSCSQNNSCDTCIDGKFVHNTSSLCISCDLEYGNSCGKCNPTECIECKNNPTYTLPLCTGTTCQNNQYQVGQICRQCSSSCLTCSDAQTCTSCDSGKFLINGQCILCSVQHGANCGNCNQFQCIECSNNTQFQYPDCNSNTCATGQTQDPNYNICWDCETNCIVCDNLDTSICTQCQFGYFVDSNNSCSQCQKPCGTCSVNESTCDSCEYAHYEIDSNCTQCQFGYFIDNLGFCASCYDFYGITCGKCNRIECTECKQNPTYLLPNCSSEQCDRGYYKDDKICRKCTDNCLSCLDRQTCTQCSDLYYIDENNSCQQCTGDCFLCSGQNTCILCNIFGYQAPRCNTCIGNFFLQDLKCQQTCPDGYYGDMYLNECLKCDNQCSFCQYKSNRCTQCVDDSKVLYQNQCLNCFQILGVEQEKSTSKGLCFEICGDGITVNYDTKNILQCDDGNLFDNDGCNSKCQIEEGWVCTIGDDQTASICTDKRPIGFKADFYFQDQYLNIEENAQISLLVTFNKTFTLPQGKSLRNYLQVKVEDQDTSKYQIKISQRKKGRSLQQKSGLDQIQQYDLQIMPSKTLKNRNLQIDFKNKQDFKDSYGNTLTEKNEIQQTEVKEYYHYSDQERYNTEVAELGMYVGIAFLMLFLPFYVFLYDNHYNRFYVLFLVIDITQILYFYRFINIRWPINGIKFFRKLKPVINFYMPNLFQKQISDQDFEAYSSGVTKFDKERESSLFMNNCGPMMMYLFSLIGLYLIVIIFSQKKLYKDTQTSKIYSIFYQLRYGYFQWGIWFDCMLASSGVFIIYIFLQFTNIQDMLNFWIAVSVSLFYLGFFSYCFIFTRKNKGRLFTIATEEMMDGMTLSEKMEKNSTFKFRNIWHFIDRLYDHPDKFYFYFLFIFRKIYIAIVLLTLQAHPKIQLSMFCFSHLIIIFCLIKFQYFDSKSQTARLCFSELLILIGVGCMYFLLNDKSENESYRFGYCWIVLSFFLFSLFIHFIFFMWQEIIYPFYLWLKRKCHKKKIVDLRKMRKEGRVSVQYDPNLVQIKNADNVPITPNNLKNDSNNNSKRRESRRMSFKIPLQNDAEINNINNRKRRSSTIDHIGSNTLFQLIDSKTLINPQYNQAQNQTEKKRRSSIRFTEVSVQESNGENDNSKRNTALLNEKQDNNQEGYENQKKQNIIQEYQPQNHQKQRSKSINLNSNFSNYISHTSPGDTPKNNSNSDDVTPKNNNNNNYSYHTNPRVFMDKIIPEEDVLSIGSISSGGQFENLQQKQQESLQEDRDILKNKNNSFKNQIQRNQNRKLSTFSQQRIQSGSNTGTNKQQRKKSYNLNFNDYVSQDNAEYKSASSQFINFSEKSNRFLNTPQNIQESKFKLNTQEKDEED